MQDILQYTVIVPVFNSSISLHELTRELVEFFSEISFEILFIDDGSTNVETWQTINELSLTHKQVRGIRFRKNFGKPSALMCGFKEAKGEFIITMDDDLQHHPAELSKLIALQEHDIVIGTFENKQHSVLKNMLSQLLSKIEVWSFGKPKHIRSTPLKLIKKEIIDDVVKIQTNKPFISGLLFSVTHDVVNVAVDHHKRKYDASGFTYRKMWQTFSNLLFNNSSLLVKLITLKGVFLLLFAIGFLIVGLTEHSVTYVDYSQWLIIASVFAVGGAILLALGILGEYQLRTLSNIEKRPAYFVKEEVGND